MIRSAGNRITRFYRGFVRSLSFLSLLVPVQGRVQRLYAAMGENSYFTDEKLFINLGFWEGETRDLDVACEALADKMATTAGLQSTDRVLDVGFGFGEQDVFWMKTYSPAEIIGINISKNQVKRGQQLVRDAGMAETVFLMEGDALAIDFPDQSFDVVFGLESVMHFEDREPFFSEAYRVLKPGGRLVLADITGVSESISFWERCVQMFMGAFWQMPSKNLYGPKEYASKLDRYGFSQTSVKSIREQVYTPFIYYLGTKLKDKTFTRQLNWAYRIMSHGAYRVVRSLKRVPFDYVIVKAEKPEA
ncbi:MAG: ubiquinone/menaquinone biosynthesis C-methylase UbiE [Candidatus Marinamargulisbacteria bacterium]|jgi:ubiquinone/menaquinone biosynthesis C-methylase UbiE